MQKFEKSKKKQHDVYASTILKKSQLQYFNNLCELKVCYGEGQIFENVIERSSLSLLWHSWDEFWCSFEITSSERYSAQLIT